MRPLHHRQRRGLQVLATTALSTALVGVSLAPAAGAEVAPETEEVADLDVRRVEGPHRFITAAQAAIAYFQALDEQSDGGDEDDDESDDDDEDDEDESDDENEDEDDEDEDEDEPDDEDDEDEDESDDEPDDEDDEDEDDEDEDESDDEPDDEPDDESDDDDEGEDDEDDDDEDDDDEDEDDEGEDDDGDLDEAPDGSVLFLARSDSPFDALVASFLGRKGPVLLTEPDRLHGSTRSALVRLRDRVDTVVVLGGTGAVSAEIEDVVEGLGYEVRRVEGGDRYETAAAVAQQVDAAAEPDAELGDVALLATGAGFADALAAGSLSCAGVPVLLTRPDGIPASTLRVLAERGIDTVVVLGGSAAVDDEVDDALEADGYQVLRVRGQDRYETAAAVVELGERLGALDDDGDVVLVRGDTFPDALSAGPLGCGSPLLLTRPGALPASTEAVVRRLGARIRSVYVLGGTAAVGEDVVEQVREARGRG